MLVKRFFCGRNTLRPYNKPRCSASFCVFRASKIYCVIGRATPAPTEISPYFAQKLTQPGSLLFTASEKSINKTYICKNKTIEKRALVFLLMSARLFIDERSFVYKWFCILMQMLKRLLKNAEAFAN